MGRLRWTAAAAAAAAAAEIRTLHHGTRVQPNNNKIIKRPFVGTTVNLLYK
jgi:hypothetical protein